MSFIIPCPKSHCEWQMSFIIALWMTKSPEISRYYEWQYHVFCYERHWRKNKTAFLMNQTAYLFKWELKPTLSISTKDIKCQLSIKKACWTLLNQSRLRMWQMYMDSNVVAENVTGILANQPKLMRMQYIWSQLTPEGVHVNCSWFVCTRWNWCELQVMFDSFAPGGADVNAVDLFASWGSWCECSWFVCTRGADVNSVDLFAPRGSWCECSWFRYNVTTMLFTSAPTGGTNSAAPDRFPIVVINIWVISALPSPTT